MGQRTRPKRKPTSPKRRLMLALRARYKGPMRRFKVEHSHGSVERITCLTCGFSEEVEHTTPDGKPAMTEAMAKKLAAYRGQGGKSTVTGHCPNCTRIAKDELFPLPKE